MPEQQYPFFIRPTLDSKSFSGGIMDWFEFSEWRNGVLKLTPEDGSTIDRNTEVMICPQKVIYNEYRVWIVDERAVAWSQYKSGTRKNFNADVDRRILEFAENCAKQWSPDRAYCMDIFESDKGLFIGEVNNINSAGFYKANMGKLVMALEEAFNDNTENEDKLAQKARDERFKHHRSARLYTRD